MAKTLLNGVNEVLKRAKLIAGDSGQLATLTDSPRQNYIDVTVQAWNEAIEDLYSRAQRSLPKEMSEKSITLVSSKRTYALASDLDAFRWPLHNRIDGEYIHEWQKGYHDLLISQPQPAEWTGLAHWAVIRPTDGELYLDRIPTDEEAGKKFHYNYDKDISLSSAADTFPFADNVFRAMVPVVSELFQKEFDRSFDQDTYDRNLGLAARKLTRQPLRSSWLPR